MNRIENFFDINMVLMTVFSSLERIRYEKKIELIYEIDATVPKELKGDAGALSHLLSQLLTFVFENSNKKEIILSISAPKDFLYEESISFEIREADLSKEIVTSFLDNRLSPDLELLDGESIREKENPSDIHINIPFKLNELGKRRHYRLPSIDMMGKKVLLICENQKVVRSIEKMFKYFLYEVDVGVDEYKRQGSDLTQYDILVIENKLSTDAFENMIAQVQKTTSLKYVLLQDAYYEEHKNAHIKSAYLIKPVMQLSIFELIIFLFGNGIQDQSVKSRGKKGVISMEKYIDETLKKEDENTTQKRKESKVNQESKKKNISPSVSTEAKEIKELVLDIEIGEKNAKRFGMLYAKELKKFLDNFDNSDVYFRQVVNEKQTWQIKEFCIDLEKQAKNIGAQRMSSFTERVSLLFVYDKLDTLPIYTSKYHIELRKLITEIKDHLKSLA